MFRNRRFMKTSLAGAALLGLLSLVLGDDFFATFRAARETASEQFQKVIGEHVVKLEKAKLAVEEATQRAQKLRTLQRETKIRIQALDRDIAAAGSEVTDAKQILVQMEQTLGSGRPVVLVSGRALAPADVRIRAGHLEARIAMADERIGVLKRIRERYLERARKLATVDDRSPQELAKLRFSVDLLEDKVKHYKQLKKWMDDDEASVANLTGIYDEARRALEEAHAGVDESVMLYDALLDASLEDGGLIEFESNELDSTDLASDIRHILNDASVELR